MTGAPRLGVLGSPITHSKSPLLHAAAARALGVDRDYRAYEVEEAGLAQFLAERGAGWRGCSLTMPLKSVVIPMCRTVDPVATRAGAVNTIVFAGPEPDAPFDGYNTDVEGVRRALDDAGAGTGPVELLGAGNTAASVLLAVAARGADDVTIRVRRPERAVETRDLAISLGMTARIEGLDAGLAAEAAPRADVDLVVNTIPGGREVRLEFPEALRARTVLFDVVYDPWPTALATAWLDAGGTVISGLEMLLHQAVAQVRLFTTSGDGVADVSDAQLLETMRAALA